MTQIIVLPHLEICPEGAVIEAKEGESICHNLLENGIAIEHVNRGVKLHGKPSFGG